MEVLAPPWLDAAEKVTNGFVACSGVYRSWNIPKKQIQYNTNTKVIVVAEKPEFLSHSQNNIQQKHLNF